MVGMVVLIQKACSMEQDHMSIMLAGLDLQRQSLAGT